MGSEMCIRDRLSTEATIANNTSLRFERNAFDIVPFSFTVSPATGKTLSLTPRQGDAVNTNLSDSHLLVGGMSSGHQERLVTGTVTDSTTVNLMTVAGVYSGLDTLSFRSELKTYHGTRNIIPGMTVKNATGSTTYGTIASITDHDTFVMDTAVTLSNNQRLRFEGGLSLIHI